MFLSRLVCIEAAKQSVIWIQIVFIWYCYPRFNLSFDIFTKLIWIAAKFQLLNCSKLMDP